MPPREAPFRPIPLANRRVSVARQDDGSIRVRSLEPLAPYARKLTDWLEAAAAEHPDRVFLAEKDPQIPGGWHKLHYAEAWQAVRAVAQALLARELSQERPIAVLSGSGIAHGILGLAAMHVGIPYCAISPAYAAVSTDHAKLRHVLGLLRPGLVFADDAASIEAAITRSVPAEVELVHGVRACPGRASTAFASLLETLATDAVDHAAADVAPDSIAKILFTSGSTGFPKGVINTQRMVASNQQMMIQAFPVIADGPLVILSWLPWHHTSGGNQMLGLTLYCAGSLYLDDGRPVPGDIERTVDNLSQIAPTVYFSVPRGFAMLVPYLRADAALRDRFFSKLRLFYYSGAGLSQSLVSELDALAVAACGERIPMMSGYGATETAPGALAANDLNPRTGLAGLPIPGCELKLVPVGSGKYEARLRGPNVTPGYWRQPEATASLFDEDGFVRMGDALAWVDPDDPQQGLTFEGRLSEDFKLTTGTWVGVGALRARLVMAGDGLFLDAVIVGEGRDHVGALLILDTASCTSFCQLSPDAPLAELASHPGLRVRLQSILDQLSQRSTGSSTYVSRAMILIDPPLAANGELTDKGSINVKALLANRPQLLATLYDSLDATEVLAASPPGRG